MYVTSIYLRAVALSLPLIASATPLLTTTFDIEGTPVVVLQEVVATTTVTIHDGAPTDCAAGPPPPTYSVVKGPNTFVSGPYVAPSGPVPDPTLLAPAIHPDIDPKNVANLHLVNKANLFYSAPNPSSNGMIVYVCFESTCHRIADVDSRCPCCLRQHPPDGLSLRRPGPFLLDSWSDMRCYEHVDQVH